MKKGKEKEKEKEKEKDKEKEKEKEKEKDHVNNPHVKSIGPLLQAGRASHKSDD